MRYCKTGTEKCTYTYVIIRSSRQSASYEMLQVTILLIQRGYLMQAVSHRKSLRQLMSRSSNVSSLLRIMWQHF